MKKNDKNKSGSEEYSVGYKKPPQHTRFRPGQSGNSKGRPKKGTTVADLALTHTRKTVTVTDGDKIQKMPIIDAIVMRHISKAAKGDHKSTEIVFGALKSSETDPNNNLPELLQQFRAIHSAHLAADRHPRSTKADNNEER